MVKVSMRVPDQQQVLRMVDLQRTERGVVVIATETPVDRYDEKRGLYKEVLLMSGVKFRGERRQIPIVDSHDDSTVKNVVGSVRQLTIDRNTGELFGEYVFSGDPDAKSIETKIKEGHITDFSITALPLDGKWISQGQVYVTERGETIEGPAHIITAWEPHNASVCATGADVNSVVRRSYTDLKRGERSMEAGMPDLSSVGVPEGMTDPNQIIAFLIGKIGASPMEPIESMVEEVKPDAIEPVESMASEEPMEKVENMDDKVKEEVARALAADRKRRAEIIDDCKLAKLDREFADKLCDSGVSADEARKQILRASATQTVTRSAHESNFAFSGLESGAGLEGDRFTVTESADDKFTAAMRDGLVLRSFQATRLKSKPENLAEGAKDFSRQGLLRMAMTYLARMGAPVDRMNNQEIARAALGNRGVLDRYRVRRSDVYNTTGSFPNLLMDAANKTLLAAYEEAPYTWNIWARQAASVEDFKPINRIRFGESPDLEMIPEGKPYPEKPVSDLKTSYSIEKFGAKFSVTWETVVNDDLDALSRVPAMHGNAARRVQNKKVYDVLFANPTMADNVALFGAHASGSNVSGGAGAPSVSTLNTGFRLMRLQTGLTTGTVLNITPSFLIVPANYEATALELVSSTSYVLANSNSGVTNIYGPNGSRPLTVVVDGYLDGNSTTNWYLAADPAQIDTVELSFLSGEESPVLESEWNKSIDAYDYYVRQTFGVAAIDWRGLFRNSA